MNKIDWDGILEIVLYVVSVAWYGLIGRMIFASHYHIIVKIFLFIGLLLMAIKQVNEWSERG